jgi:DNA-binding transcriptional MerR regulator/quercetin dioxygenase-like cupin family protein
MYISESGEMLLSIQEAAKEIGVVPATIRNWEKQGIFISKRTGNGYRVFNYEDMTRLRSLLRYSKEKKISINAANILFTKLKPPGRTPEGEESVKLSDNATLKPLKSDKWKKCRLERGYILEDVARAVNISPSYLYKIENEQTNVSLDILQRLADFYGENLLYYIAEAENEKHLVKKGAGEKIDIGLEGVWLSNLLGMSKFKLQVMQYHVAAHSGRTDAKSHHGEEFVYILSGKIHFTLDGMEYILSAGDSFGFRSEGSHTWFNHENREATLLWVYTAE